MTYVLSLTAYGIFKDVCNCLEQINDFPVFLDFHFLHRRILVWPAPLCWWRMDPTEEFIRKVVRIASAQTLQEIGFTGIHTSVLDTITDIASGCISHSLLVINECRCP